MCLPGLLHELTDGPNPRGSSSVPGARTRLLANEPSRSCWSGSRCGVTSRAGPGLCGLPGSGESMMTKSSSAKSCQDASTKEAMAIAKRKNNYNEDFRHGLKVSARSCLRQSRVTCSGCSLHVGACQFRSIRLRRRRPRRHSLCNQKRRASKDRPMSESGPKN